MTAQITFHTTSTCAPAAVDDHEENCKFDTLVYSDNLLDFLFEEVSDVGELSIEALSAQIDDMNAATLVDELHDRVILEEGRPKTPPDGHVRTSTKRALGPEPFIRPAQRARCAGRTKRPRTISTTSSAAYLGRKSITAADICANDNYISDREAIFDACRHDCLPNAVRAEKLAQWKVIRATRISVRNCYATVCEAKKRVAQSKSRQGGRFRGI